MTHYCKLPRPRKKYLGQLKFCRDCMLIWKCRWWNDGEQFTGVVGAYPLDSLLFLWCGTHDREVADCLGCQDHHRYALRYDLLQSHVFDRCDMCNYLLREPDVPSSPSYLEEVEIRSWSNPVGVKVCYTVETVDTHSSHTS